MWYHLDLPECLVFVSEAFSLDGTLITFYCKGKGKGLTQEADLPRGVPGRLRPRIFLTCGTTRVVGRQPYATAAFTPGEIPGTHFQRLSRPKGTCFLQKPRKKSPVTPPAIDPGTSGLVGQCLKHYATPGSHFTVQKLNQDIF